jgi:hypothetical protein
MGKALTAAVGFGVVIGLIFAGVAMGNGALRNSTDDAIMLSPATIVLAKVTDLTVHTNCPANLDDLVSIDLDGVEPAEVWANNCGDLVARVEVEDLELDPEQEEVALTLTAVYADGTTFAATDVVRVK